MIRLLQSPWVISAIGSIVYFATTCALIRPQHLQTARAAQLAEAAQAKAGEPSWNFQNPELEKLIAELRQEKELLQAREQQLKALESRLQSERNELAATTQIVYRLQKQFDQDVLRLKEEEAVNCKKLGKLHAAMSPEGAANIFREMPDDDVVKIFAYMKVDEVSAILDTLGRMGKAEAKRAAQLTDRMRRTMPPTPANKPAP